MTSARSTVHVYAVIDSADASIAAMGGDYRQDHACPSRNTFEKLGDRSGKMGQAFRQLCSASAAQYRTELEIPAIGGKDSMSGTFMDIDVPPTLASHSLITAV